MEKIEYSRCSVVSRTIKYGGYLELEIENRQISQTALPGYFVMIRGWEKDTPLLSRPFDILAPSVEKGSFKLVIKLVGKGTRKLAELKEGGEVMILGPLGRGIEVPRYRRDCRPVTDIGLLVRGVGAAAVVLLAEQARAAGINVRTFITAVTEETLVCRDYLEPLSETLSAGWDRGGGSGKDGRELIDEYLKENHLDLLYTCGSRRFGRFVQDLDRTGTADGYLFMESRMACGMGDCHGCTVETPEGEYLLVCQDGPIFPAGRIKL